MPRPTPCPARSAIREPGFAGPALDRPPDVPYGAAGAGHPHGVPLGGNGRFEETAVLRRHLAHGHAGAGVGPIAVELGGDVNVHEVAGPQHGGRRWDAVGNPVVDADAARTGKPVREPRR